MSEARQPVPVIDWSTIGSMISRYETLIGVNERNKIRYDNAVKEKNRLTKEKNNLKAAIDRCTEIYKDVKKNLDEKRIVSLQEFQDAIDEAACIVADSDMKDVKLVTHGDEAVLCNLQGHNINNREGGAQRAVLGQMLRYVAMTQQLNVLPLLVLDESFFALSDNTSVIMRDYLLAMSEHMIIIGIEQNDTIFNGIENKRKFIFSKGTDSKTIIREV